jgi:hypothetical protein
VTAGTGITVTGSGTAGNPFVITSNVQCSQVRPCISAGNGAAYNPATGVVSARPSSDAGNTVVFGTDQGLFVPATAVTCAQVRPCISAGPGATYNPVTGVVGAKLSTDAGNNVIFGTDQGLYVPAGAATVQTACGLDGDGSASNPLTAAVGTWPYPCSVNTSGGVVACDASGVLRSEPRGMATMTSLLQDRNYPNLTVPAAADSLADTFSTTVTNPDPCRPALVVVEREVDVVFDLPAGAGAASGFVGDEMFYTRNGGPGLSNDVHTQTTKVLPSPGVLAPGASTTLTVDISAGRGSGGATYNRILVFIRALMISL